MSPTKDNGPGAANNRPAETLTQHDHILGAPLSIVNVVDQSDMNAIQVTCQSKEWWGDWWRYDLPYEFDVRTIPGWQLTNAPVSVCILTPDPQQAAQLLAAKLESEPQLLKPLSEPGNSANTPSVSGVVP